MSERHQGGCACGAVRYELKSEPFDCGWCHCTTCRRVSGAPAMAFATVPVEDFVWTEGADKIRLVSTSSFARRSFCGDCGSPLTIDYAIQPETIDFAVGTLDAPERVAPGFHIFWASRVAWFDPADGLPRFDRFRPDTRGLEGTEPPE